MDGRYMLVIASVLSESQVLLQKKSDWDRDIIKAMSKLISSLYLWFDPHVSNLTSATPHLIKLQSQASSGPCDESNISNIIQEEVRCHECYVGNKCG